MYSLPLTNQKRTENQHPNKLSTKQGDKRRKRFACFRSKNPLSQNPLIQSPIIKNASKTNIQTNSPCAQRALNQARGQAEKTLRKQGETKQTNKNHPQTPCFACFRSLRPLALRVFGAFVPLLCVAFVPLLDFPFQSAYNSIVSIVNCFFGKLILDEINNLRR